MVGVSYRRVRSVAVSVAVVTAVTTVVTAVAPVLTARVAVIAPGHLVDEPVAVVAQRRGVGAVVPHVRPPVARLLLQEV